MQSIFTANRTALITGASAGIGLELTRALAPKLDALVVVARRRERLEQVCKKLQSLFPALNMTIEAADLSDPEAVEGLLGKLEARGLTHRRAGQQRRFGGVRVVRQIVVEQNPSDRPGQYCGDASSFTPSSACDDQPRARRNSEYRVGGRICGDAPNAAVYTASKHFVRAFTESLRAQLAGTGITVSEAAPGPVDSEFDQVAGIRDGATPGQSIFRITAQKWAADIVREFEKGSVVIFPDRNYRWLMQAQRVMPRRLVATQIAQAASRIRYGRE